jgi:hypothetical protein
MPRGIGNLPPDHRHPPSPLHFAIVTSDAPPNSSALSEITELLKCPIQTPACRRDTCARRKLGGRVVYALEDLKAWADRGAKTSTSDPGAGTVLPAKRHAAPIPYAGQVRR